MKFKELLGYMLEKKASDLHIRSDSFSYVRIDGKIVPLKNMESVPEKASEVEALAVSLMNDRVKKIFDEKGEVDFSLQRENIGRFRFNVFRQRGKLCIAIRSIPLKIPSMEELNLKADILKKFAGLRRGLVLVTGVTGSGKSTTLASMIDHINKTRNSHVITIEDPIEFVHNDGQSIISQREVGQDTKGFLSALRSALRQDPDVILLGEMRDHETAQAALTAAETGHLVFSTMHTISAVQTVSRICDLFPVNQQNQIRIQLAGTLKGVISQRLLLSLKGGRIPAQEILLVTSHIKKLIEDNRISDIYQAMQKGEYYGMQTFNQSLLTLKKAGLVNEEEVLHAATSADDVKIAIEGIEKGTDINI
jgi:twitching motility protein PilT